MFVNMLRKMVKGGFQRYDDFRYVMTNNKALEICNAEDVINFVSRQQTSYLAHIVRQPNTTLSKRLVFNDNKYTKQGRKNETLEDKVLKYNQQTADQFFKAALKRNTGHGHPHGFDRRKLSKR